MRDLHEALGYAAIAANALAGLHGVAAWQWPRLRGRVLWALVTAAEATILAAVLAGVYLVAVDDLEPARFHMFYGFVAFATVGLLYSYKHVWRARGWIELAYGLGGFFLVGLALRAVYEV